MMFPVRSLVAAILGLALCACGASAEASPGPPAERSAAAIRRPPPKVNWHYQLQGNVEPGAAQVVDMDGFDTPASFVLQLRRERRYPICYINAGTWEDWRPDKGRFPSSVLGNSNGWPGERWLDIRRLNVLAPIMRARMRICRDKRFRAVETDNVDGYLDDNTGFPLTGDDQLVYNRGLARTAHRYGLAIGLKNDFNQMSLLVPYFDFAVVEECFTYEDCHMVSAFTRRRKAVFDVEYAIPRTQFCPQAQAMKINGIEADQLLNGRTVPC